MTHSIARLDGTPIVEMTRLEDLDLWSVLLATGRFRIVSGHEIADAIRDDRITEDDIRTAQQWEIEQHLDEAFTAERTPDRLDGSLVVLLMAVGVVLGVALWFAGGGA